MRMFSKLFGGAPVRASSGTAFAFASVEQPLRPEEYGYASFTWAVEGGETLVRHAFMAGEGGAGMHVPVIVQWPRLAMLHASILEAACYHVFARAELGASDAVMEGVAKGFTDALAAVQVNGKALPADLQQSMVALLPRFAWAVERDMRADGVRDPNVVNVRASNKSKLLFETLASLYPDAPELALETPSAESFMVLQRIEATCDSIMDSLRDPQKHGLTLR